MYAVNGSPKERAFEQKEKVHKYFPYPDEVIDRLARAFYPAILACWNSEEGQREFAAWQAEQAHISGKEKSGSSRWGTPCLTYRVWIFAGCVRVGAPCFCFMV